MRYQWHQIIRIEWFSAKIPHRLTYSTNHTGRILIYSLRMVGHHGRAHGGSEFREVDIHAI
jgi:hypothetical protein